MKILLLTTLESEEMLRLKNEAKKMGNQCDLVHLGSLSFSIVGSRLKVSGLPAENPDVVIVKGITRNKAAIVSLLRNYRRHSVRVFDNNYADHQYTINKVADLMKLAMNGLPVPDTYHLSDFDQYEQICREIGYPVIIKLIGAGKGAGVFKADDQTGVERIISLAENEMAKTAKRFILQKFINYEHDLRVLIIGERTFVMKRIPAKNEFRANFSLGGKVEMFPLNQSGIELARRGLSAVGMSIGGVDLLITRANKRYILEVNHTPGFLGMEKATGENVARIYLEHALSSAY